jgi:hypothetical protein
VGEGVSPPDPTPNLAKSVLERLRPITITKAELAALLETDRTWKRIQREITEAETRKLPTPEEVKKAFQAASKSYARYLAMANQRVHRDLKLEMLQSQLKRRAVEVERMARARRIHEIRRQLGAKWQVDPSLAVGGPGRKPRSRPSPETISFEP